MKNILLGISIAIIIVQVITEGCQHSREHELNCGNYCFQIIRPLLDHMKSLQTQVENKTLEKKVECPKESTIEEVGKPSVGFSQFQKIGSKYYFIEQNYKVNWFDAVHRCISMGAHLASIQNLSELNAIVAANLQINQNYWIDLNDLGSEGAFLSVATGLLGTYYNWHSGNPSDSSNNEDCVELHSYQNKFIMNDNNCAKKQLFICEHDNK